MFNVYLSMQKDPSIGCDLIASLVLGGQILYFMGMLFVLYVSI